MPAKKRLVPPLRPNADGTGFVRATRPAAPVAAARNRSGGPRRTATPPSSGSSSSSSSSTSRSAAAASNSRSSSLEAAAPVRGRPGGRALDAPRSRLSEQANKPSFAKSKSEDHPAAKAPIKAALAPPPPGVKAAAEGSKTTPVNTSSAETKKQTATPASAPAPKVAVTASAAAKVVSPATATTLFELGVDAALGPSECLVAARQLHQLGVLSGAVVQLTTSYGAVVVEARSLRGGTVSEKVYVNDDVASLLVEKRVQLRPVSVAAGQDLPVLTSITLRPVPPEDASGAVNTSTTPPVSASLASTVDWQSMFRRALHHRIAYAHLRTTQRVLTQRLTLEVVQLATTSSAAFGAGTADVEREASSRPSASAELIWGLVTDATALQLESGTPASGAATPSVVASAALCTLVVGESGTGKSRWLKRFSEGQLTAAEVPAELSYLLSLQGGRHMEWVRVEQLPQGEGSEVSTATALRESIARARQAAPAVLLVDDLHLLCARESSSAGSRWAMSLIAHAFAEELLDLQRQQHPTADQGEVWVVATAPSLDSLDGCLTGTSLFGQSVVPLEMPTGAAERLACLRACLHELCGGRAAADTSGVSVDCLQEVAERAHGFTQRDLHRLAETAVVKAFYNRQSVVPQDADLRAAAAVVHPSSLKRFEVCVPSVTWDDIGGSAEAKQTLCDVVEWCLGKQSWIFTEFNLTPPKGVLLYGPPGCSKTMLAKALANESHMNFISVKGPEVFSKWVGDSEKAVRDIFERARAASPCVVFIDELDGMCGHRGRGGVSDRVISQFLTELDGLPAAFEEKKNALVFVAATNRPDSIDGAVLRPGRIDRRVYVGLPSKEERTAIAAIQFRHIPVAPSLTTAYVAERTDGYTGAEVVAVVKEAAFHAITADAQAACVTCADVDAALLKVRPRIQAKDVEWYKSWPHNTPTAVE